MSVSTGVCGVVVLILVEDLLDLVLDFFDDSRHDEWYSGRAEA